MLGQTSYSSRSLDTRAKVIRSEEAIKHTYNYHKSIHHTCWSRKCDHYRDRPIEK